MTSTTSSPGGRIVAQLDYRRKVTSSTRPCATRPEPCDCRGPFHDFGCWASR